LVELLVAFHPLDVFGPRGERGLQRALAKILLEVGGVVDLLEERDIPVHGVLRHVWGPEDPAQHQVVHVRAQGLLDGRDLLPLADGDARRDRKSTRLNSSHVAISYAVFCLKKKIVTTTAA